MLAARHEALMPNVRVRERAKKETAKTVSQLQSLKTTEMTLSTTSCRSQWTSACRGRGRARYNAQPKTWQADGRGRIGEDEGSPCWSTRAFYNSWWILVFLAYLSTPFPPTVTGNATPTPTVTASAPETGHIQVQFPCNAKLCHFGTDAATA